MEWEASLKQCGHLIVSRFHGAALGNGVRLYKPFCTSSGIETLCGTHRGPKEVSRHVSQCCDPVQKTPFGLFLSGGQEGLHRGQERLKDRMDLGREAD